MKPQMLLLPGLLCDHAVWTQQVSSLQSDWDCRIAEYADETSISDMAHKVLALGGEQFTLVGHSMGGRVAMEVARLAPERIKHLILMDTGYRALATGDAGKQEVAGRKKLVDQAKNEGMRAMGQEWMQGMVHPDRLQDQALCNEILDMIERRTPTQFAGQQKALIDRPDATPVLQNLTCSVHFICGRQDQWSPLDRHFEMAELCPRLDGRKPEQLVTAIEDSGHMSTMERPDAVTKALVASISQ